MSNRHTGDISQFLVGLSSADKATGARRNSLLTVYSLPPELLTKVFLAHWEHAISQQPLFPYRWTDVTHVCRLWRNVAIGCPMLWGYIASSLGGSPLWELYLSRSGESPLRFRIEHASSPLHERALGFPFFHRMQSYYLKGAVVVQQFLNHPFPDGGPILRSLHLDSADGDVVFRAGWSLRSPLLNELVVAWVPSTFLTANPFPSLRHLDIRNVRPVLSSQLCLTLLSQLPRLESFRVVQSFSSDTKAAEDRLDVVTLRHLRLLAINVPDDPTIPTELLEHLILAKGTKLELRTGSRSESASSRLLEAIHTNIISRVGAEDTKVDPVFDQLWLSTNPYATTLRLFRGPPGSFCTKNWPTAPSAAFCDIGFTGTRVEHGQPEPAVVLSQLCSKHLVLSDIRVLCIETATRSLFSAWRDMCHAMVNVHTLCVSSHILSEVFRLNDTSGTRTTPFPHMRSLTLRRTIHEPLYPSSLRKLVAMVKERNGTGSADDVSPIENLHICGLGALTENPNLDELEVVGCHVEHHP